MNTCDSILPPLHSNAILTSQCYHVAPECCIHLFKEHEDAPAVVAGRVMSNGAQPPGLHPAGSALQSGVSQSKKEIGFRTWQLPGTCPGPIIWNEIKQLAKNVERDGRSNSCEVEFYVSVTHSTLQRRYPRSAHSAPREACPYSSSPSAWRHQRSNCSDMPAAREPAKLSMSHEVRRLTSGSSPGPASQRKAT